MPIQLTVDSLDGVSEDLRSSYTETDGKYTLDPDKYAEFKKQGVLSKNSQLLKEVKELKESQTGLRRFEKLREFDDEQIDRMIELAQGQDTNGKPPQADQLKAQLEKQMAKTVEKHKTETAKLAEDNAKLAAEVKHYKLTVPLRQIALEAGVFPDDLDYAIYDTAKYFKLDDAGKITVLDEDGDPASMTPEKFFKEVYKDRRPRLYAATGAGGSGAQPTQTGARGAKVMKRSDWDKLSGAERAQAVKDFKIVD